MVDAGTATLGVSSPNITEIASRLDLASTAFVIGRRTSTESPAWGRAISARHKGRETAGVGGDVVEEPPTLIRRHLVVLQQFDGALYPGQGRLELMAHGGGEIAQIAGPAIHGLGHPPEVLVESPNFDGGGGRRRGKHAAAVGDIARRPAERLDRTGDAARDQNSQKGDHTQGSDDAQPDLDPVLVQPLEQGSGRAGRHDDPLDPAIHHHRPRMVDTNARCATEPFHGIARAIGVVATQDRSRFARKRRAHFGQIGQAAALAVAQNDRPVAIQQEDRGQGCAAGLLDDGAKPVGDLERPGLRHGSVTRRGPRRQDRRGPQVDRRGFGPVVTRIVAPGGIGRNHDGAGPIRGGYGRQDDGLGDQFRLRLTHQGVLIDPQEYGAEPRQDAGEDQHGQQDGPKPERRPVIADEGAQTCDHASGAPGAPRQGPSW